jgi:diguanylate cyclase (GGDEF)-like protein
MKEILDRCIELDTAAQKTYAKLAAASSDPELRRTFERMGIEERGHVQWWTELRDASAEGRLPALPDESGLLAAVNETADEVAELLKTDPADLSSDEMLELAIRMEFFMLDPAFGEIVDMLDPGSTTNPHREAYSRHVMRLVKEIEDRHTDRSLASFLARVLARTYRDQERLSALATRDPLTGLFNRRGFYSSLAQWCSLSERYGHSIGVLVVDVDHFKTVNDTFGHPSGDEVLCAIANALSEAVRGSDLVARYGGDEFAVLAPETSAEALLMLAERVLSQVHGIRCTLGGREVEVSVSVGGAFALAGATVSPEILLARADESLYEAKRAGRDCAGPMTEVK